MDFFHCNVCFFQPKPPTSRKFLFSSCGHLFCNFCEKSESESQCKVCGIKCKLIVLSNCMPENVQIYFSDVSIETKKIIRTLLIKLKQCQICIEEYIPQLESRFQEAKSIIKKQCVQLDILAKEISKLREQNEALKREKKYMMQSQSSLIDRSSICGSIGKEMEFQSEGNPLESQRFLGSRSQSSSNFFSSPLETSDVASLTGTETRTALELLQNRRNLRPWSAQPQRTQTPIFRVSSTNPTHGSRDETPGSYRRGRPNPHFASHLYR